MNVAFDWSARSSTTFTLRLGAADDPRARNPGALTAAELAANRDSASAANIRRGADKAVTQTQLALGMRHDAGRLQVDATVYGLTRGLENPLATPPPPPGVAKLGNLGRNRPPGGRAARERHARPAPRRVTAGVDAQAMRDDRTNRRSLNGVATDTLLLDQRERVSEHAVFAQLAWPLNSRITIRGGARQDMNHFAVADHLLGDGDASAARTMQANSGNAGISVRVGGLVAVWTDLATVFETPTTTELANRPDGAGGFNPDLNPQRSLMAEAGAAAARAVSRSTRRRITPHARRDRALQRGGGAHLLPECRQDPDAGARGRPPLDTSPGSGVARDVDLD